jgi:hypothetical protein
MQVYESIAAVTGELAKVGIAKTKKNETYGASYMFRGIDDVYNALSKLLSEHKLCILPRVLKRDVNERITAKGNPIFYVVLDVEYDLVSAIDGSKHTIAVIGEAMDMSDKATNKAMSAAYKYMALQVFCIPVKGENFDTDFETHKVKSNKVQKTIDSSLLEEYEYAIKNSLGLKELSALWLTIPRQYHILLKQVKDDMKLKFSYPATNMPDDDVQDYPSNFNEEK